MKQKGIIGIVCLLFTMLLLSMQTVQAVSQDRNTEKLLHDSNVEVVSQSELYQTDKLDIPDLEFRKWIWNNILNRRTDNNSDVITTNYAIYESDLPKIQEVRELTINYSSIIDLTGIEYFENVTVCNLYNLKLDTLSIELDSLEELNLWSSSIGEYVLKTPNLKSFYSLNMKSEFLYFDLPLVESITMINGTLNEIELDTPQLKYLHLDNNGLEELNIDLPNLESLFICNNRLTKLVLNSEKLVEVNLRNNQLTSLELNLPALKELGVGRNKLSSIEGEFSNVETLFVNHNHFASFNLSGYPNLKDFAGNSQTIHLKEVVRADDGLFYLDFTKIDDIETDRVLQVEGADTYDRKSGIATFSTLPDNIKYLYNFNDRQFGYMDVTATYDVVKGYKVTFMDGFHDIALKTQILREGQTASAPQAPDVEGYQFVGWDYDFSEVTADMVITAIYEKVILPTPTYKIDFNTMGGILLPQQEYELGSVIQLDMVPIREGYQFVGWYLDEQYEMSVSEIVVRENVTLYAKWEEIEAPVPPVVEPEEEDKPLPPVVEPEEEDKPLPPVVEPEEEDKPLPPVVEPEEEDKPLPPVVNPEEEDKPIPPVVEPEEEEKPLPPVVAPEEDGSTSPEMKPESPQGDENPTEKPPGTGTQSQLGLMMLLLVVSLFGFFFVKQNRI
ncbi:MAG: InlB B-repeat-containing protein [Erysipelotrichaceae bacterium]